MSGLFYYLLTFAESVTGIFGVRFYEQPRYAVVDKLGPGAEIRRYEPREAIEATVPATDRDQAARQAFGLLFDYITGENKGGERIAMTAPVRTQSTPKLIEMTAPAQTTVRDGTLSMRFYLPGDVTAKGAPRPDDPHLHLVQVPESTVAALRYSGVDSANARAEHAAALLATLKGTAWRPEGPVFSLNYDPPFTIPMLRRNEAAVEVSR
jgi:hypothetical protein